MKSSLIVVLIGLTVIVSLTSRAKLRRQLREAQQGQAQACHELEQSKAENLIARLAAVKLIEALRATIDQQDQAVRIAMGTCCAERATFRDTIAALKTAIDQLCQAGCLVPAEPTYVTGPEKQNCLRRAVSHRGRQRLLTPGGSARKRPLILLRKFAAGRAGRPPRRRFFVVRK